MQCQVYVHFRVAVKLLEFKDMLRTELAPEPHGESVMCIRHLKKMGYHIILVSSFTLVIIQQGCHSQGKISGK